MRGAAPSEAVRRSDRARMPSDGYSGGSTSSPGAIQFGAGFRLRLEAGPKGGPDGHGVCGPSPGGQVEDRRHVIKLALAQQQAAGRAGDEEEAEAGADAVLADLHASGDRLGLVEPAEVSPLPGDPRRQQDAGAHGLEPGNPEDQLLGRNDGRRGPPDQGVDARSIQGDQGERQEQEVPGPRSGAVGRGQQRPPAAAATGRRPGPGPPSDREEHRTELRDLVVPGHDRVKG